jgi:hypothetical protein
MATTSYAAAAELSLLDSTDGLPSAGMLWERAARAASTNANWTTAVEHAGRARDYHRERGQARAAARAQAIAGEVLRMWGRHAEARAQLTEAVEVLRAQPDHDTVRALEELAAVEVFAGSPEADRLTAEALALGQALGVGARQLAGLLETRGLYHGIAGRRPQAAAYIRESVRLATQSGDNLRMGRALLNLSDTLADADPAAGAVAGRTAVAHLRRVGARDYLAWATTNLAQALLMLGDWDGADDAVTQAADSDGLADYEFLACYRGWLAALRGEADTAESVLAGLRDLRASEDPQVRALVSLVEASAAAARRRPDASLRSALGAIAHLHAMEISHELMRWAWPLAARAAHELDDSATARDLLARLDAQPLGHLAPMLRAERDLVRARLAASHSDQTADTAFASAISELRELSTPYHLAHGLLDYALYLLPRGEAEAAGTSVEEAREIAGRLRCQPLLDRAEDIDRARPRVPG